MSCPNKNGKGCCNKGKACDACSENTTPITDIALQILEDFPIHKEVPASVSGKHHVGETQRQHLEMAVAVMKHLCREFNIPPEDEDMLIGATYLHDIGQYVITSKGNPYIKTWKYFEETGYARSKDLMKLHPIIGALLLDKYEIPRKEEIKRLISVHMSHWYGDANPQPETFYERLICIADYVASKGKGIFE